MSKSLTKTHFNLGIEFLKISEVDLFTNNSRIIWNTNKNLDALILNSIPNTISSRDHWYLFNANMLENEMNLSLNYGLNNRTDSYMCQILGKKKR